VTHQVTDLRAEYKASGNYFPSAPVWRLDALDIVVATEEGRATMSEKIEVLFTDARRLVFHGALVPDDLEPLFKGSDPTRIEKRDGSLLLLSNKYLVEVDPRGTVTRKVHTAGYSFSINGTMNSWFLFMFSGGTRTSSGGRAQFEIGFHYVRSIEFK
jgi:hypothetical protein